MMHRARFWMVGVLSLTLVLLASSAFAAQNVGNTSQKGSLLIFPFVIVSHDNENDNDDTYTLIHISNAGPSNIKIQCVWMNEKKVRVDFDLVLTAKGSALIDALTGEVEGPVDQVNPFPHVQGLFEGFYVPGNTGGSGYANKHEGELVCFAVDNAGLNQVSYNHLKGEATIIRGGDDEDVAAFEYTAWSFTARQPQGTVMGAPGTLVLDGLTGYDACPQHLVLNFSPKGTRLRQAGDDIDVDFGYTKLGISTCTQDLRESFPSEPTFQVTQLVLNTWNADERKFSGNFECADTTWIFKLDSRDVDFDPNDIYDVWTLGTKTALVKIAPGIDFRCSNDGDYEVIAPGLVGVAATELDLDDLGDDGETLIGTNMTGQGARAGQILWSPVAGGDPEGN
jgi:hypothetical protein